MNLVATIRAVYKSYIVRLAVVVAAIIAAFIYRRHLSRMFHAMIWRAPSFWAQHPVFLHYLHVLRNITPDLSVVLLALAGLGYLVPEFISRVERSKILRRLVAGVLIFFGIAVIVLNEVGREEQEQKEKTNTDKLDSVATQNSQVLQAVLSDRTVPEVERRRRIENALRNEYILSHPGISPAMLAGTEYPPANWMNDRLRQLGEKWAFGEQPYLPKPALTKGFLQAGKREFRYTQFIPESRLEINMGMINKGTEPTYHSYGYMAVELVENAGRTVPEIEATDKKQLHKFHVQAIANYSKRIRNGDKGEMLGVGDEKWNTFGIQNLTQPQVDGLLSGDNRFFIYYWAKWNGAIDDLQECYWLQKPDAKQIDPPKLVWHICHQ